jgi:hypothetical protein
MIQTMTPEEKIRLFSNEGIFSRDATTDSVWIPKAIELVTPYLKDENRFEQFNLGK